MKAIRVHELGGPEVLKYEDVPDPTPGPGQAVVKVRAAGVNFADHYVFRGDPRNTRPFPRMLGNEAVGTVAALGDGVTGLRVGEMVAVVGSESGTYAELTLARPDRLIPVPSALDPVRACAILTAGRTAYYLTHETYPIQPGDKVLVHAAAGGVGSQLVQLAKHRGAYVYATVSSDEKAAFVKELGADETIIYTREDFSEYILKATDGVGVQVIYDSVGGETFEKGLSCVAVRGHLINMGQASGPPPPVDISTEAQHARHRSSVFVSKHHAVDYARTREELVSRVNFLFRLLLEGELRVHVHKEYPLADASDALRDIESRGTMGKLILVP